MRTTRLPAPATDPADDRNRSAGKCCRSLRTDDAKRSSLQNRAGHWPVIKRMKIYPKVEAQFARRLAGKVALVTGGSRGIGAAIAKRLAVDGAAVALTYSASPAKADEVVRSIKAAGGKALAIKADAADTEAVRLAVAKTIGTFGAIDILVNNAGTGIFAPIEQFSLEDFEKLIAINVRGLFVATQEAARHLREGGRIIHIGSTNSERMPFVGGSVYALTKGAVAGFTKGLARDLGPRGITVNNVQPGPIDTDMNPAA